MGIVGVAGAVFGGLWAVKDVWSTVWLEAGHHAGEAIIKGDGKAVNLLKRAMDTLAPVGDKDEQSGLAPLVRQDTSSQRTELTRREDSWCHCTVGTSSDNSVSPCRQSALPRVRSRSVCKLVRSTLNQPTLPLMHLQ